MSHFYSTVSSKNSTHNKCGNKDGMTAHIRGWNIGIEVHISHIDGKDVVTVYKTGGSNGGTRERIAQLKEG